MEGAGAVDRIEISGEEGLKMEKKGILVVSIRNQSSGYDGKNNTGNGRADQRIISRDIQYTGHLQVR